MRVHPVFLYKKSSLASLHGVRNGIEIDTDLVGKVYLAGSGAGRESTASGLISDLIAIGRSLDNNTAAISHSLPCSPDNSCPIPNENGMPTQVLTNNVSYSLIHAYERHRLTQTISQDLIKVMCFEPQEASELASSYTNLKYEEYCDYIRNL